MDRRSFLGSALGAGSLGLAGCLDAVPSFEVVNPVEKRVSGIDRREDGAHLVVFLERRYWYRERGPRYKRRPNSPLSPPDDDVALTVDEDRHEWLTRRYEDVKYGVHFCSEGLHEAGEVGCRGTRIGREDFNDFALEDRILVRFDGSGRVHVQDVHQGEGIPRP